MPRVSVLMPVFNSEAYLADALASIREQTFEDLELVVVNDGSTDGSSQILKAFVEEERRMRLIERENRGLIDTRNELLQQANGELVAWMDSDDVSHPDRLLKQVAKFDADPSLVCLGTNIQRIDPEGRGLGLEEYPEEDHAIRVADGIALRFASTMQKRAIAVDSGGFRHPFRLGEDLDFLLRVAERGKLANLRDPLYVYRQHLSNTCNSLGANWSETRYIILELAKERRETGSDLLQRGGEVRLPAIKSSDQRKLRPIVLLDWGHGASIAGDRKRALRYTMRSVALAPLRRDGWRQLGKLLLRR